MELGHLLTRSGLTYPRVSSKVYHDSFCHSGNSVSLPRVIYYEAFYLHVVSSFSCIPVICPKLVLFLNPLQFVYLFCNLSQCILLLFSCISSPAVILLPSLALIVQVSLPYNKKRRALHMNYQFSRNSLWRSYRQTAFSLQTSTSSLFNDDCPEVGLNSIFFNFGS